MATNATTYTGEAGVVKFSDTGSSAVIVASVRSFTLDQETQAIETSVMGSGSRAYIPGLKQFSGSMDLYFRDENQGQINLFNAIGGGTVSGANTATTIELYPSGESPNNGIKLSGTVIITGHSITANFDGMVECSVTFQGSGALTRTDL
jgi:predicted secreted protein